MTIEEMNEVIQKYCYDTEMCTFEGCAIKAVCDDIDGMFSDNEYECREAYGIIMDLQKTQPDTAIEHDGCKGCKHEDKTAHQNPCSHCRGSVHPFEPYYDRCPDLYEAKSPDNPYWERINALAEKQRAKGINKYGVGLESNPAAILERISHLQEELIDGLMYCEWIKDHLKELEG